MHDLLPRLWFRHFTGTSWIAEDASGPPVGFLVGFISPDHPGRGYIHMVGVNPNQRRSGLAPPPVRAVLRRRARPRRRQVHAITWPGNRISVGFHTAIGFVPSSGPGTQNLYGTVAYPDYDYPGDDRVAFTKDPDPEPSDGG